MDFLLTLVSNENAIEEIQGSDKKDILNNFKESNKYKVYANPQIFENAIEYNDIQGIFAIKNFESLLYSKSTLSTYKELINVLYNKNVNISTIKKELKDLRKQHKIYFIEMPVDLFGLTMYDGTILLNDQYYDLYFRKSTDVFTVYFTLFHEYANILSRLLRGDKNNFLNTGEFTKKNNSIIITESGDFFEQKFLLKVLPEKSITKLEADYLLKKIIINMKKAKILEKIFWILEIRI